MKVKSREILLQGTTISEGIAIGYPVYLNFVEDAIPEYAISPSDLKKEVERYRSALEKGRDDVCRLKEQLENENLVEAADILEAHMQIMSDPMITSHVETKICEMGKNAEYVFHNLIVEYQKKFTALRNPQFRDKFKDIQDISLRVLSHLKEKRKRTLAELPQDSIVFALELTASDIAEVDGKFVKAFITQIGSAASHATIVAKAKGIPLITNIDFGQIDPSMDCRVIVDGRTGEVFLNPSDEKIAAYRKLQKKVEASYQDFADDSDREAETVDGYTVRLSGNIEMAAELDLLHAYGGSGVGLFRSENAFLSHKKFPTEEEQFFIYRNIVEKMNGLPIVFRVFDLGGDKFMTGQEVPRENNPFLGCRAIRLLLQQRTIFETQLRAIVRASAYGDVSIMFPMISTLSELLEAKNILAEVQKELERSAIVDSKPIRVGCMIEVPSAAIIADLLAKECDFLSIGTNDLVQYSLAVDRGNQAMSELYSPAHPSVIRLIKLVVNEANHQGIPVTVCGEVAADPKYIPLLLGLGVHELSVASRAIPIVKRVVRGTSIVEAGKLVDRVMRLGMAAEIEEMLISEQNQFGVW